MDPNADARHDALLLFREHGYSVAQIIRVLSPGDARCAFEEVLYVTPERQARRGYIMRGKGKTRLLAWSYPGWDLPTGYEEPETEERVES